MLFIGIEVIWTFILSALVAPNIGWAPSSPFQTEVAFSNLSIDVLGVLYFIGKG